MDFTEKTVKRNYLYRGAILNLRVDDATLPSGEPCKREIVEHMGGAAVLCVIGGKVVLVRQYRYAYGETIWEIPAGKCERGEDPAVSAQRELKEETGLIASVKPLLNIYPSPGYTDEIIHIYEAIDPKEGEQKLDEGEYLEVKRFPLEEAYAMMERGEIRDAKTVVALLSYKNR